MACGQHSDSVTKAFYDRGWRGINIDPLPSSYKKFCEQRPEDVNLLNAVGTTEGETDFFEVVGSGLSTFDPKLAEMMAESGIKVVGVFTATFAAYERSLETTAGTVLAFPAPTAWLMYALYPMFFVYLLVFVTTFRSWFWTERDEARFEALLERTREASR